MRSVIAIILVLFPATCSSAADVATQKVDEIFAAYNKPSSPGCSVGVIRDGSFILRKSYGQGSLELGVPLSSDSVFYMASVSKQFTAASVVLAAEQGLLSLDDDVRKYLPELPEYGRKITLRQMLHNTAGFRDFETLFYLSGRHGTDLFTKNEIMDLIARQKGLNEPPGEAWVYSNTNFYLLGEVVKRATKKSLADFAAENIFKPLGMVHSRFYDDRSLVMPGRVPAYTPGTDGEFLLDWSVNWDVVGPGGLMSSVNDLLQWDDNFYKNRLGKGTLVRELETHGSLNNGHPINYGLGLWLSEYRGLKTIDHSGATFGYRTQLLRFPDQRFSAIVLCNIANADVEGFARRISDVYLKDQMQPEASGTRAGGAFTDAALFAGTYLDPHNHMIYTFSAANGNLKAWGRTLQRLGANEFSDVSGNPIVFRSANGTTAATLTLQGEGFFSGSRVPNMQLSESALGNFTGNYRSDELQTTYTLSLVKGALTLKIDNLSRISLHPVAPNEFQAGDLGTIVFRVTSDHHVSGLTLYSQPARGIVFDRAG